MDVTGKRMFTDMAVQACGPTIPDLDKELDKEIIDGVLMGSEDLMQDYSPILRQRMSQEEDVNVVVAEDITMAEIK